MIGVKKMAIDNPLPVGKNIQGEIMQRNSKHLPRLHKGFGASA